MANNKRPTFVPHFFWLPAADSDRYWELFARNSVNELTKGAKQGSGLSSNGGRSLESGLGRRF